MNFTYFSMQVVKQWPDPLRVGLTCSLWIQIPSIHWLTFLGRRSPKTNLKKKCKESAENKQTTIICLDLYFNPPFCFLLTELKCQQFSHITITVSNHFGAECHSHTQYWNFYWCFQIPLKLLTGMRHIFSEKV